eukprot:550141_1
MTLPVSNNVAWAMVGAIWAARGNLTEGPIFWCAVWSVLARYWLIYYELNYSNSLMNKQWKAHLDPSLISKDFWLRNKSTYGTKKYAVRTAVCLWIICSWPATV